MSPACYECGVLQREREREREKERERVEEVLSAYGVFMGYLFTSTVSRDSNPTPEHGCFYKKVDNLHTVRPPKYFPSC